MNSESDSLSLDGRGHGEGDATQSPPKKFLHFWKVQSIGNDFPLISMPDVRAISSGASDDFMLTSLSIQMSDRRFGVGGDGLLAYEWEGDAVRLRMFNPDGTEDFCGNGLRCVAWHVHLAQGATRFMIKHLDREVPVWIEDGRVFTKIGVASYNPDHVPTASMGELYNATVWNGMDAGMPMNLFGSALTTGSSHVVISTYALPDDDSFKSVSPKIEVDPMYPQRTSVIWRREIEPMKVEIRIWERGVGETQGCGTGSSAAAADYLRGKGKGGRVEVQNPGGTIFISMDRWDAPITVEGTAEQVYEGHFLVN